MYGGKTKMAQKTFEKAKKIMPILAIVSFLFLQVVLVSAATTATYDEILKPIQAIYDLVKYSVTIIAGLVMLFAGITYISSGSNPTKREQAKNMVMYVLIGLIVIWAAPFVVKLLLGN
jgi:cation transport ATPase